MTSVVRLISSMATRHLLTALANTYRQVAGAPEVVIESVGGVDAARRVQEGEPFDLVVLANDAMAKLERAGRLRTDSLRPIADSSVGVAVREGGARPDISTEDGLIAAVLAAKSIGFSTGPSGTALLEMFTQRGLMGELKDRLVQAPPGVPVGRLVADGQAELGFQQLSELMGLKGITLLGCLPTEIDIVSRFSGSVPINSSEPLEAQVLLEFMASPMTALLKQQHGMRSPVDTS